MKLPESMPDLIEKIAEPLSPSTADGGWISRLPMKLGLAIPLGAVMGAYFGLRFKSVEGPGLGLVVGLGVMLFVWTIGVVVTVIDHFQTRKRRANKRPPASFD